MDKRSMTFGAYNTATDGLWTLASWKLADPVYEQNFIKIPGGSNTLDMSTALSDGEPTYGTRELTATFESSEGSRLERKARIDAMINALDGRRMNITLPDDNEHYLTGRMSVQELYNDNAHASVSISAICDPWKYAEVEEEFTLTATATEQTVNLVNDGRKALVPTITVTGGDVTLTFGTATKTFSPGTYSWPDLFLKQGDNVLTYSGSGTVNIEYREAVL